MIKHFMLMYQCFKRVRALELFKVILEIISNKCI